MIRPKILSGVAEYDAALAQAEVLLQAPEPAT